MVGVDAHVVGGRRGKLDEVAAAILTPGHTLPDHIDPILVCRVDVDVTVVHRPRVHVTHHFPGRAAILRAVGSLAGRMLYGGVEDPGIGGRDGQTDPSLISLRNSVGEFHPTLAAIRGFVDPTAGAATCLLYTSDA